jgi:outer membrane lipoprotein-sorting protein
MKKTNYNQKGIAHLLILVLMVAVVAGIGFAGYKVSTRQKTTTKTNAQPVKSAAVTADQTCLKQLSDADLCKFATNYNALDHTAYSMVMTSSDGTGTSTFKLSRDANGNDQGSFKSDSFSYEVIDFGNYSYSKDENGSYSRYPKGSPDAPPADNPLKDFKLSENNDYTEGGKISYQKLGQEACGSVTCFKYKVVDKTDSTMNYTVWFDTKNHELRRMLYNDPSGAGGIDLTITYENVVIKAPTNWHDFVKQQ